MEDDQFLFENVQITQKEKKYDFETFHVVRSNQNDKI